MEIHGKDGPSHHGGGHQRVHSDASCRHKVSGTKELIQQQQQEQTHSVILFMATNVQNRRQISWSSTRLSTKFMAKFGKVMENWFLADHGLNFGLAKFQSQVDQ
jgi:hypothetical protein